MTKMGVVSNIDVVAKTDEYNDKLAEFSKRYPLIDKFGSYANEDHVCEYINLVDTVKGV